MGTLHFEGRDINSSAEYVDARELIQGETYFTVQFVDDQMLVPELHPLVFIGENLEPGDSDVLYFQDAASHAGNDRGASHHVQPGVTDGEIRTRATSERRERSAPAKRRARACWESEGEARRKELS